MTKFLGKYSEYLYALLRIVAGWCFLLHGATKLFGWPGGEVVPIASRAGLAGIIEFGGGLLILLGLFASWAAFIAAGEMAVAYFTVHAVASGIYLIPLPPELGGNKGELAVVYCFLFLFVAAKGAGKWSLAAALKKPALE